VFALDAVPPAVADAVARVEAAGTDLVRADAAPTALQIEQRDGVTAWCPEASSSPYLLRLAHDDAGARFDRSDDPVVDAVAVALRDSLRRLREALGDVPYNVVVHTAPRDGDGAHAPAAFHWYVEVTPRVSIVAGFEQATGIFVNTVPPDQAAEVLRGVTVT
jgi:UDPglucose--hexose-1-phosphate uridylyltransferase